MASRNTTPQRSKLAKKFVFSETGLSPAILAAGAASSPVIPDLNLEYSRVLPQASSKIYSVTPKGHKHCRCKYSKCLKLYCQCFGSGVYCDGCDCVDCFNNVENEDARLEATESILERNPHAFKPKIYSSPCSAAIRGDPAKDSLLMGIHNRGCCCKRTHCIKKYCECFQANILCSENCKCIGCENLSSGNSFSEESSKSKSEEFLEANKKNPTIQELAHNQQENLVRVSGPLSASFVDPCCHIVDSEVSPSKIAYRRSLLADAILPSDIRQFCSILVTVSAAANALAEDNEPAEAEEPSGYLSSIDVQKSTLPLAKQSDIVSENDSKCNGTDAQERRYDRLDVQEAKTLRPDINELTFNECKVPASSPEDLYYGCNPDVYMKHERLILTCLRDWLEKFSTFGSLKAGKVTGIQEENLKSVFTKSNTEI